MALLVLGTAFWGISFSVTKLAIGDNQYALFLFYRFTLATLVLSVIFWKHVKSLNFNTIKTGAGLALPPVAWHLFTNTWPYTYFCITMFFCSRNNRCNYPRA